MDDGQPAVTSTAADMDLLVGSALTGPAMAGINASLFEQYDGLTERAAANDTAEAPEEVENLYLSPG